MLEVNNLTKRYKFSKSPSIKNISFSVDDGEVFGIIGKNGAGKSTTIKCILGVYPFENGSIVLNGIDLKTDENLFKKNIGYVPDNHMVYESLTGREYVNFMANAYGDENENRDELIEKYARLFELDNAMDKQILGYSHGMRQKICIIGALIHRPCLWVLDEPFLGLDSRSVNVLKKNIKLFSSDKNHMVIFTSHDLDVVVDMCDRVCVIGNGEIVDIFDMSKPESVEKIKELMA